MGNVHSRGFGGGAHAYVSPGYSYGHTHSRDSGIGSLLCLGALTAGCCFFSSTPTSRGLSTTGLVLGIITLGLGIAGFAAGIFTFGLSLALVLIGAVVASLAAASMSRAYQPADNRLAP
jgi:hypothetical protein